MAIETLPKVIWEPAAGKGAIVKPLRDAGYEVIGSDLVDYGEGFPSGRDYLLERVPDGVGGIVTNPPFTLAEQFIRKAVHEVPYSAWLLRTNFLESTSRLSLFLTTPPARVWISSRRLPMIHQDGWDGPRSSSNICYAWFIFEAGATETKLKWFDWRETEGERK